VNKVPAPETSMQGINTLREPSSAQPINSREFSPAQLRLCVSGAAFCSGITPCTGCLGMIRDQVLGRAMDEALTSPSQQAAFLHVFMGACVNGNEFCTGINPCEPCLIKIKNELLPTAISAMALSRHDQALTLMQVFLNAWREMLIRYVTERSQPAPPAGENAPPQVVETYEINDPGSILNSASPQGTEESNQPHGGGALNGSNGHKPKPQNVVRRPSKKQQTQSVTPVEKKEK
jgi:hypothetical protein